MLRSLDFLGLMKWPSLLAVTAVPMVSFAFWGDFDDAVPMRGYGQVQAGLVSIDLRHPASADPRRDQIRWCARPCRDCGAQLARAEIAYGAAEAPSSGWAELAQDALDLCAELPAAPGSSDRIWLRLIPRQGETSLLSRPLKNRTD